MISHKHKCIFIHIPKTAGMSIYNFFHPNVNFYQDVPNYDILFGWCPKRQLHMQHATAKQLLETELVSEEQWNTYYKFTFVRNPWDRAYSDYLYVQRFSGIRDTFNNFILKKGRFKTILNDNIDCNFMGDHLMLQTNFFDFEGKYKPDFIGRFESFNKNINIILNTLDISEDFNVFENKSVREQDYSIFYTGSKKMLVEEIYKKDIQLLGYKFEDGKKGIQRLKNLI